MKKRYYLYFITIFTTFYLVLYYFLPTLKSISGYSSKLASSYIYLGNKSLQDIKKEHFNHSYFRYLTFEHDVKNKTVSASFWGDLAKRTSVYKKGLGCILIDEIDQKNSIKNLTEIVPFQKSKNLDQYWPEGEKLYNVPKDNINYEKLNTALSEAFEEDGSNNGGKNTKAVLVIHDGKLILEKYEGMSRRNKILGWSMTKSVFNTLVGVLIQNNKLDLNQNKLFQDWEDEKEKIELKDLLSMTSGLEWNEDYKRYSDATRMLFLESDMSEYAKNATIEEPTNTKWMYSSGTSLIISKLIKNLFVTNNDYWAFPQKKLFEKLNMEMVLEIDQSGTFVASSYAWASPSDWAKLALLYYNKGKYKGEQIIPEDFVTFSTNPVNENIEKNYGASFWLNTNKNKMPDVPEDCYYFNGYQGQRMYIIPSKKLIVVRFGNSHNSGFDDNEFLSNFTTSIH